MLDCLADFLNRAHAGNFNRNFSNEKSEDRMKEEWSARGARHRRQSDEGRSLRSRLRRANRATSDVTKALLRATLPCVLAEDSLGRKFDGGNLSQRDFFLS